jgi:UDP-GlcNAc:undecaprenyl-phosphate GlcNAc-1-phosphate transferase
LHSICRGLSFAFFFQLTPSEPIATLTCVAFLLYFQTSDMSTILLLGALALVFSIVLTPVVRDVFLRLGFVDEPDNDRKLHVRRIPRVGGIAVFVAYLASFLVVGASGLLRHNAAVEEISGGWWLLAATSFIFLIGLLDDLAGLRPKQKLIGQVIGALLVWSGGVRIHVFEGVAFHGWTSLLLTVAWLVLCTNAFNLIDGLDGLAAGAGLFSTVTMIVAGILGHNPALVIVSVPLAGCLIGFLVYNFNPASIFLGDCGSLTLGFFLGCVGTLWSQKISTFLGLTAPVMALSLPLIDTSLAIARRVLRNRPLFSGDRGHIHHRLLDRGNTPRQVAYALYGVSAIAAACSLLQQTLAGRYSGLVVLSFCVLVWVGIQHLGYLEFVYVRWFLVKGTLFRLIDDQIHLTLLTKSLSGANSQEEAFVIIKKTCHDLGFSRVYIQPSYEQPVTSDIESCHVRIPLGTDYVMVLTGLSHVNRPIALPQLMAAVRDSFQTKLPSSPPSFALSGEVARMKHLVTASELSAARQ